MSSRLAPVIALSHGGGPMPLMGDPKHASIVSSLQKRVPKLLKLGSPEAPRAIVVVTAHWSETRPTISSGDRHQLLYDYYGFPPETYELKYDAPGSNEVAKEVQGVLTEAGLSPRLDGERGWDHGVFVPLTLINPSASIPIIQLSVLTSEDASAHFAMGRALYNLRQHNIAIIGSGFASFHNLRLMFSQAAQSAAFRERNAEWSRAVTEAVSTADVEERGKRLEGWREWPNSFESHPRGGAEHFLPLIVAAGAGGEGRASSYTDDFIGLQMHSYYWSDGEVVV